MTAQDLKNSILQLAVQGKLVQQYPEDGTATDLLKHIAQKKSDLIKDGALKKEKPLPAVDANNLPFDVPENWVWIRLGDFCSIYNGNSINAGEKAEKYSKKCDGHSFIATKDVGFDHSINYENGVYIPLNREDFRIAPVGSVLLCMEGGSAGRKIGILEQDVCFGNKLCCLAPFVIFNKYLYYFLQSPAFFSAFTDLMTGIIGGVGAAKIKSIAMPVPPLAEQERIVAKVEELLPLVSEYGGVEKRIFALNAEFPDKLRKSILQQAVQGKLTERDPSDEPAIELLDRIRAEKAKLIAEGKIKKERIIPVISEEDQLFDIPDTWTWTTIADTCTNIQYGTSEKSAPSGKVAVLRMGNLQGGKIDYSNLVYTSNDYDIERCHLEYNDLLFNRTNSKELVGKTAIYKAEIPAIYAGYLIRVTPIMIDSDYLNYVMQSHFFKKYCLAVKTDAIGQSNINAEKLKRFVFPLPPLAEQKRIVARVEDLLAACDMLK